MIREIRIFERSLLCKMGRFDPVKGENRGGEKVVFAERKKRQYATVADLKKVTL